MGRPTRIQHPSQSLPARRQTEASTHRSGSASSESEARRRRHGCSGGAAAGQARVSSVATPRPASDAAGRRGPAPTGRCKSARVSPGRVPSFTYYTSMSPNAGSARERIKRKLLSVRMSAAPSAECSALSPPQGIFSRCLLLEDVWSRARTRSESWPQSETQSASRARTRS